MTFSAILHQIPSPDFDRIRAMSPEDASRPVVDILRTVEAADERIESLTRQVYALNHGRMEGSGVDAPDKPRRYEGAPMTPTTEYREIPLTRGLFALVDATDYEWLMQWKWWAKKSTNVKHEAFYAVRTIALAERCSRKVYMARELMNCVAGDQKIIDHINGDTLDNRRVNLRFATCSENNCNQRIRSDNTSGFKGIYLHKASQLWHARVNANGKTISLGYFKTPTAAHNAYAEASTRLYGEFARTK